MSEQVIQVSGDGCVKLVIQQSADKRTVRYAVKEQCDSVWFTVSKHEDVQSALEFFSAWSVV